MKILLAEDDENIALIAQMALEQFGQHEVSWVNNGSKALELALSQSFDLILLDEMMPGLNGARVCADYQAQSTNPAPVIFMSAKSQDSDIEEFLSLALGHILKPFEPTTLCSEIEVLMKSTG